MIIMALEARVEIVNTFVQLQCKID